MLTITVPQSIGSGQTISQPYIVALMSDLLNTKPNDIILEVGTGSGYQAAILSKLVAQVYSIEVIDKLASNADQLLKELGYENVVVRKETVISVGRNMRLMTASSSLPPRLMFPNH